MKINERDARLKLLTLQGAIYRGEIVEAKIRLGQASKPLVMTRGLFRLLSFVLERRKMALISALASRLLVRGRSSRFVRRMLLIMGSSLMVWWLMRRRS